MEKDLHGLSTQQLRVHLKDQTRKWLQHFQVETGQITVNPRDRRKTSLEGTAGTENPQYFMFWTNERLLELISQSLVGGDGAYLPLGPSSTIVMEFTQSPTNAADLNVQMYVNDQLVSSQLCGDQDTCPASAFATRLEATIADQDVSKICQPQ